MHKHDFEVACYPPPKVGGFTAKTDKLTSQLVENNALIIAGDKTKQFKHKQSKLAKSVYDATWFGLKRQLETNASMQVVVLKKLMERYTT